MKAYPLLLKELGSHRSRFRAQAVDSPPSKAIFEPRRRERRPNSAKYSIGPVSASYARVAVLAFWLCLFARQWRKPLEHQSWKQPRSPLP
jgi:hypothetical protein